MSVQTMEEQAARIAGRLDPEDVRVLMGAARVHVVLGPTDNLRRERLVSDFGTTLTDLGVAVLACLTPASPDTVTLREPDDVTSDPPGAAPGWTVATWKGPHGRSIVRAFHKPNRNPTVESIKVQPESFPERGHEVAVALLSAERWLSDQSPESGVSR